MEGPNSSSNIPESEKCNERLFEELFDRLATTEQRLAVVEHGLAMAEQEINEQASRRYLAEQDLGDQIQEASKFEDMYYKEWSQRKSVEAELDKAKKRIEELEKLVDDQGERSKRDEQN